MANTSAQTSDNLENESVNISENCWEFETKYKQIIVIIFYLEMNPFKFDSLTVAYHFDLHLNG